MDDDFSMEDRKSSIFQQEFLICDTNDVQHSPRSEEISTSPTPMSILTDLSHQSSSSNASRRHPIDIVNDIVEVGNNLDILFHKMIQQEKTKDARIADLEEELKKKKVKLIALESELVKLKSLNSFLRSENVWLNHMVNKHVFVKMNSSQRAMP